MDFARFKPASRHDMMPFMTFDDICAKIKCHSPKLLITMISYIPYDMMTFLFHQKMNKGKKENSGYENLKVYIKGFLLAIMSCHDVMAQRERRMS